MSKDLVKCPFKETCEYGQAPPICRNCKRNMAAKPKDKKWDTYQVKR